MADPKYSISGKKIWVAGHRGMVGSALVRRLAQEDCEIITASREELDLLRQADVEAWLNEKRPDAVFLAAAKVGGIHANNSYPADFIYQNLMIEANIIHGAHLAGVEKLLFLGSSCIYPRMAPQPIPESALLTGPLETTNEWYAVAKIAGIKLCQAYQKQYGSNFISAMPTNLFGPGDNYDLATSHVVAALMVKIHQAKMNNQPSIEVWGTGTPKREFLHVDDLADGLVFLMENYSGYEHVNVGSGTETTIRELAEIIAEAVDYNGTFAYNTDKPDGTPRKLMDSTQIHNMGWRAKTDIKQGMASAYQWYLDHVAQS